MALKIDMKRAYDQIEWSFLMQVLKNFGFDEQWCLWIWQCISTVSFSVLINGSPTGLFNPKRGIRQGDPLSPFLFILCSEILSRLIIREVERGGIHGIKISRGAESISHLLFVDDLIIFDRADLCEGQVIKDCIEKYSEWSGQSVNSEKSRIHFSNNFVGRQARSLADSMGFRLAAKGTKYLGLPLFGLNSKKVVFDDVVERVQARLKGWKAKFLSQAAGGTLIKTVMQALPAYTMSSSLLPKSVCASLDSINRRFWWGVQDNKKGLFLKSWDSLCKPKLCGGLGFRRSADMNRALLSKLAWALESEEDSLWARITKAKYFPKSKFKDADPKGANSWFWQGVSSCKGIVRSGACYIVGNGVGLNWWKDPWIPFIPGFLPSPRGVERLESGQVSELRLGNLNMWDENKLSRLFDDSSVAAIKKIHLDSDSCNMLAWCPNKSGKFSVKSANMVDQSRRFEGGNQWTTDEWSRLWNSCLHERFKVFLWKVSWGILPSREMLHNRIGIEVTECPLCHEQVESLTHLFLSCSIAKFLWISSIMPIQSDMFVEGGISNWIKTILNGEVELGLSKDDASNFLCLAAVIMDFIWWHRNQVLFNEAKVDLLKWRNLITLRYVEFASIMSRPRNGLPAEVEWILPPDGWIKINCDVAIRRNSSCLAAVFRDSNGRVVEAFAWESGLTDPLMAEAKAILLAIKLAKERNMVKIMIEGDAVKALKPLQDWLLDPDWCISRIIRDAKRLLEKDFDNWTVIKIHRDANYVAYNLAQWACNSSYFGSIPLDQLPLHVFEITVH